MFMHWWFGWRTTYTPYLFGSIKNYDLIFRIGYYHRKYPHLHTTLVLTHVQVILFPKLEPIIIVTSIFFLISVRLSHLSTLVKQYLHLSKKYDSIFINSLKLVIVSCWCEFAPIFDLVQVIYVTQQHLIHDCAYLLVKQQLGSQWLTH